MAQPPVNPVLARQLVRVIPFTAQRTIVNSALGNGSTLTAEFDVGVRSTDVNQLLTGAFPGATNPLPAIGPFLDALVFSNGSGTLLVQYAVDRGASYRQISNSVVPANTAVNISGLRITGRFVLVTFTNTSGGVSSVEFGAYVRSQ